MQSILRYFDIYLKIFRHLSYSAVFIGFVYMLNAERYLWMKCDLRTDKWHVDNTDDADERRIISCLTEGQKANVLNGFIQQKA